MLRVLPQIAIQNDRRPNIRMPAWLCATVGSCFRWSAVAPRSDGLVDGKENPSHIYNPSLYSVKLPSNVTGANRSLGNS